MCSGVAPCARGKPWGGALRTQNELGSIGRDIVAVAIVTGSSGLIGSEAVDFLCERGFDVVGIDNDMRAYCFGPEANTAWSREG
jgi:NAD dependent epimerase/dehydratase family